MTEIQRVTPLSATQKGASKTAAQLVLDDGAEVVRGYLDLARRLETHLGSLDSESPALKEDAEAEDTQPPTASSFLPAFRRLNTLHRMLQHRLKRTVEALEKTV